MERQGPRDLLRHFDELEDPRMDRTRLHRLDDIIAIAILAVTCGADGWVDVELFGQSKYDWLKTFLHLPNGIPSHDTFGRVFAKIDPEAFEQCFHNWVQGLVEASDVGALHIDGKTLRRSFDGAGKKAALHMVSMWASKSELALGQIATDQKSNEITAMPRLLELITLHGAVVTIDAMGCQRDIAEKIVKEGGDYILAVKDNQPELHDDLKLLFAEAKQNNFEHMGYDFYETTEKDHGRIEIRRVWVTREVDWLRQRGEWAGLRSAVCVESQREVLDPAGGPSKRSSEIRYYISSVDHRQRGYHADFFARTIRSHWGVENKLHWSLDVSFGEDQSRVRQGHGDENLTRLRRMSLNLLKREPTRLGIAAKRRKAGWDNRYLLKVLTISPAAK